MFLLITSLNLPPANLGNASIMRSQIARTLEVHLRYRYCRHSSFFNALTHHLVLQAFPGSSSKTSLTFVPRLVIPRSCLPLALLDPNGTSGHLEGNRIFSAKTPSLATSLSPGKHIGEPVVLIAESSATPRFYAVEQVRPGIYALCQLYSWITLKNLEKLNLGSKSQFNLGNLEKAVLPGDKWWHQAAIQSDGAIPSMKRRKSWTAEGIQLCLKSPMHQNSIAASPGEIECGTRREEPLPTFSRTVEDLSLQGNDQNADEILNMIRSQYREALYMSQVRSNVFFWST